MSKEKSEKIKESVRERYGSIAKKSKRSDQQQSSCGCCSSSHNVSSMIGYSDSEISSIPDNSDLGLGCGNPVALASLKEGETVLDLGSGAGIDCFLAANKVGKKGKVIGVDMTPEMIKKARENAKKGKYSNVEFRKGEIEDLPVDNDTVDVIISNCVINLVPDKKKAFAEAFRVLKPGGRLMVSDIVLRNELPKSVKDSVAAYTACVSGALLKKDYLEAIESSGFEEISIASESAYPIDGMVSELCDCGYSEEFEIPVEDLKKVANSILSVKVSAIKPS